MKMILLILIIPLFLWGSGFDYSAMSTQELLAIMNYTIIKKDENSILKELKNRIKEMSKKEKKEYELNLKLLKKQNAK